MLRLTRAYSIASLVGIALIAVALGFLHRHAAVNALIERETRANVELTQAFANTLWPKYAAFVARAGELPRAELPQRPEIAQLDTDVRDKTHGLPIVKIKLYDLRGLTVYSTEPRQIGEDKSGNAGFRQALAGRVVSETVFRDHFSAFERIVEDRHLISSYVPIRRTPEGPVEGVFEVYSDITPLVGEIRRTEWLVLGVVTTLMLLLYTFLLVVVRRADRLLRQHEEEERRTQREHIRFLAYHDPLTSLGNRALFTEKLRQAVDSAKRQHRILGLMYIDLDRFKTINDGLGHEAGDQTLLEATARIRACLRHTDTACRMGGDEFTVILENLTGTEEAGQVASRLIEAFAEPMQIGERRIVVSASVGVTVYPDMTADSDRLLKDADAAMQRAKAAGRNRYLFYSAELDQQVHETIEYEMGMRQALARHEFTLFYQPVVDTARGALVGAEALLRWRHPARGLVLPGQFVALLEDSDMAVPVGEWAIRTACRQCRQWHDAGRGDLRIAVNVSPRQFHARSLPAGVRAALADSGLPAPFLEIELTERVLLSDAEHILEQLRELKQIGVRLVIDDFGTGYSSLNYLTHFPIDCLKIDRTFVHGMVASRGHAAVTSAIVALARTLDLDVVAEGVETREQLQYLHEQGCHVMQGHLFSEAVPAECFDDAVARLDMQRHGRFETAADGFPVHAR